MPCFFCIAVFLMLSGAVTSAVVEALSNNVGRVALAPPRLASDSRSTAVLELDVAGPRRQPVPVRMTVYKAQQRVRIQVLTHDVDRAEAQHIEQLIADAAGLRIVGGSDPASEAIVHETVAAHAAEHLAQQQARPATWSPQPRRR